MARVAPRWQPRFRTAAEYWDWRYADGHGSGDGSYGDPMFRKVEWLSRLNGIETITEVGCGDWNFGEHLMGRFPDASYLGLDISEFIVRRNRKDHGSSNRIRFELADGKVPSADLVLCVDVLFHILDPNEHQKMLIALAGAWTKYLALSAYEYDGLQRGHINIRKFDPSWFGKPILREVIEDDGEMYFYIFAR
jgi:hypothetical protein